MLLCQGIGILLQSYRWNWWKYLHSYLVDLFFVGELKSEMVTGNYFVGKSFLPNPVSITTDTTAIVQSSQLSDLLSNANLIYIIHIKSV